MIVYIAIKVMPISVGVCTCVRHVHAPGSHVASREWIGVVHALPRDIVQPVRSITQAHMTVGMEAALV